MLSKDQLKVHKQGYSSNVNPYSMQLYI